MPTDFIPLLLIVAGYAVILMVGIWALALWLDNLGIVDIAWGYSFTPIAILGATLGHGDPTRKWLIAGLTALWSLRLGTHLFIRVASHHPKEDTRYAKMREKWKNRFKLQVLLFFEIQAVLVVVLSIPVLMICENGNAGISALEWTGAAIWLAALLGEGVADWQLKQFKARNADARQVCRLGLWNYSRHPNYFFEWLIWVGLFIFALDSPYGWVAIYCPALMFFFLIKVTGIPLTEELAVKSKGDAYREYQRTTSMFVPWFKKV